MRLLPALSVRKVDSVYLDGAINRPHKVEGSCPWNTNATNASCPSCLNPCRCPNFDEFRPPKTEAPTGQWNPSANQRLAREWTCSQNTAELIPGSVWSLKKVQPCMHLPKEPCFQIAALTCRSEAVCWSTSSNTERPWRQRRVFRGKATTFFDVGCPAYTAEEALAMNDLQKINSVLTLVWLHDTPNVLKDWDVSFVHFLACGQAYHHLLAPPPPVVVFRCELEVRQPVKGVIWRSFPSPGFFQMYFDQLWSFTLDYFNQY